MINRGWILGCLVFLFALGCEAIDSGELNEIEDANFDERASTGHTSNNLKPGGEVALNQYLQSSDGSHRLYLQGDGNLVLRRMSDMKALWASGTNGKSVSVFRFRTGGDLVLKTASGSTVWSSKTDGSGATELHLHSAGKLVLYRNTTVVWSANGAPNPTDNCPNDPNKTEPGKCGCGVPEGTCGEDDDGGDDGGGADSGSSNTLLVHDGAWKYVYCSGSTVKVSSSSSKKQRWVKRGERSIYNETVKQYLYCPERDGGYAPTLCKCSGSSENYHTKTSKTGGSAPATIPLNRDIYIAPNNNMNACFKVIRGDQVHAPCAIEPWRNQTCRKDNGDSFSSSEHALPCNKFRLNG
jgi:hypothetical protein